MRKAREIRKKLNLSLQDVTRKTSIGIGHLAKFERGEAELSHKRAMELVKLYSQDGQRFTIEDLWEEVEPAKAG